MSFARSNSAFSARNRRNSDCTFSAAATGQLVTYRTRMVNRLPALLLTGDEYDRTAARLLDNIIFSIDVPTIAAIIGTAPLHARSPWPAT